MRISIGCGKPDASEQIDGDEKSSRWPQFLAAFCASCLAIGTGIQIGWPSPSIPKLLEGDLGFNVTEEETSYIVLLSPLGYIVGSPLCGFLIDRIGRKYTLLSLAPIQVITWLVTANSQNVETLYFTRILMGVSDGGMYTALPAYLGEVTQPKIRGRAATSLSLGILLGQLLINIYGSYVPIRTAAYISIFSPVLFVITFALMPESPYYFIAKGADDKARNALGRLTRMTNVETEFSRIKTAVQLQQSKPGRFQDIFTVKSNLKAIIILAVLRMVQQFSGMFVVGFYIQYIFQNADSSIPPEISAIICMALNLIVTCFASFLLDRYGRRIMIFVSGFGTVSSLLILGTYFLCQSLSYNLDSVKWLPLSAMILYYICCPLGLLIVPTLMMGELLPSNIKAKALSIMNIYFGLCISGSSKLFYWTESSYGVHVPFYIYAGFSTSGIIFTYFFVPETKGKTLEEIQQVLMGSKTRKESKIPIQPPA